MMNLTQLKIRIPFSDNKFFAVHLDRDDQAKAVSPLSLKRTSGNNLTPFGINDAPTY